MDSAPKRPWYRLHWVTWVVMGVVLSAAIREQCTYQIAFDLYGWPLIDRLELGHSERRWEISALVFNVAFCSVLVVSSGCGAELWLRRQNPLQIDLRSGFVITGVLACVCWLVELPSQSLLEWRWTYVLPLVSWSDLRQPLRWPILFAIACTIYTLGYLAFWISRRTYRMLLRARR